MTGLNRRRLLQASIAAGGILAAPQIKAQSKPEKLVYVGDNGPWHWTMVEEVAPDLPMPAVAPVVPVGRGPTSAPWFP